jgi:hypothetical protein
MRYNQPAAHFLLQIGPLKPEIGLELDKWQNLHGACLQKQLQLFLSLSFDLIRESSSAFDL